MNKFAFSSTILGVCATALLIACGGSTEPVSDPYTIDQHPLALPLTNRIVFQSDMLDTLKDIFSMKLDGSDLRRLTDNTTRDVCPEISPDGKWIAFYRKAVADPSLRFDLRPDSVAVMSANGVGKVMFAPVNTTPYTKCPFWSRDSKVFGVADFTSGGTRVRTFSPAGGLLYAFTRLGFGDPSLSPDGARIAGDVSPTQVGASYRVVHVALDGTDLVDVGAGTAVGWLPSGEILHYCPSKLCVIKADGTGLRILGNVAVSLLSISWDGMFAASFCYATGSLPDSICRVSLIDGLVVRLPVSGGALLYRWTSDGQYLVFQCQKNYQAEICRVRSDGTGLVYLTDLPSGEDKPSLSPSG